jgi:hypothetical protein
MQHPVADLPAAHRPPLITDQEESERHVTIIVDGRQSSDLADLAAQPRYFFLFDIPP